jgi:hypothetical protein
VGHGVLLRDLSECLGVSVRLIRLIFLQVAHIPTFLRGFYRRGALCGRVEVGVLACRVPPIVEILHPKLFFLVGLDNQLLCLQSQLVIQPDLDKWRHLLARDG